MRACKAGKCQSAGADATGHGSQKASVPRQKQAIPRGAAQPSALTPRVSLFLHLCTRSSLPASVKTMKQRTLSDAMVVHGARGGRQRCTYVLFTITVSEAPGAQGDSKSQVAEGEKLFFLSSIGLLCRSDACKAMRAAYRLPV